MVNLNEHEKNYLKFCADIGFLRNLEEVVKIFSKEEIGKLNVSTKDVDAVFNLISMNRLARALISSKIDIFKYINSEEMWPHMFAKSHVIKANFQNKNITKFPKEAFANSSLEEIYIYNKEHKFDGIVPGKNMFKGCPLKRASIEFFDGETFLGNINTDKLELEINTSNPHSIWPYEIQPDGSDWFEEQRKEWQESMSRQVGLKPEQIVFVEVNGIRAEPSMFGDSE